MWNHMIQRTTHHHEHWSPHDAMSTHSSPYSDPCPVGVGKEVVGGGKTHNRVVGVTRTTCHLVPRWACTVK